MFKGLCTKISKIWQVITGRDEETISIRVKQAEMKALAKAESRTTRSVFKTVDNNVIVPQRVIDAIKSKLMSRFADATIAKSIYDLIEAEFQILFRPEFCFELIVDPNALDNTITYYTEKYARRELDKCSLTDLAAYFRKMEQLKALLYPEGVPVEIIPEPVQEPISLDARKNSILEDKAMALAYSLLEESLLNRDKPSDIKLAPADIVNIIKSFV